MKKKSIVQGILLGTVIATGVYCYSEKKKQWKELQQIDLEKMNWRFAPTLLLHGTYGTKSSMGSMISRFEKEKWTSKVAEISVDKNGKISFSLTNDPHSQTVPSVIHVLFKDSLAEDWEQALWLQKIMQRLKSKWNIHEVNAIGHSMGGIAILRYLIDYGNSAFVPKLGKFVSIGAPFNGEVTDPSGKTQLDLTSKGPRYVTDQYLYYAQFANSIPTETKILNIYGDLTTGSRSDGIVSIDSVRSLGHILEKTDVEYTEVEFSGWKAQHSLLHENKKVDRQIATFMGWNRKETFHENEWE